MVHGLSLVHESLMIAQLVGVCSLESGVHSGEFLNAGRLVEDSAEAAVADADNKLGDPKSSDKTSIIGVGPIIGKKHNSVWAGTTILGPSQVQGGKLAHSVESEASCRDESSKVDAAQAAHEAETEGASLEVVSSNCKAKVSETDHEEGDAAEAVDDGVTASLLQGILIPVSQIHDVLNCLGFIAVVLPLKPVGIVDSLIDFVAVIPNVGRKFS